MRKATIVACMLYMISILGSASIANEYSGLDNTSDIVDQPVQKEQAEIQDIRSGLTNIIKSINFVDNRKFKDKVLRQRLGFKLGDPLDPYLAENGRKTIIEVYRKIGFAFVNVGMDLGEFSQGRLLYIIEEGPRVRVKDVKFVGNKAIGSGTLKKLLKTKERKWLTWPSYYTEEAVEEDLEKLRQRYYEQGFLNHRIEVKKEFTKDKSKVRITFMINEGPIYHINEVEFVGNEYFDLQRLQEEVELKPDQIYLKKRADLDAKKLAKLYHEHGFIDAQVRQKPKFVPEIDVSVVDVEFQISEGKQFRIGRIDITGNEMTQDKVVRRVLDEYDFTPGQLYNADMAPQEGGGKLEGYVKRMVLADDVIIRPVEATSGDPNSKDLKVDVTEGMTGMIMPGVGASSDSGVIGRLIYIRDKRLKNKERIWK